MRIITALIIAYTLGSLFSTITDLAAIKNVQATTVQLEQPSISNRR